LQPLQVEGASRLAHNPRMPEETQESRQQRVAVIMERSSVAGRWGGERWEATGVLPDEPPAATAHRVLVERPGLAQLLFPGHVIRLQRDEAEGYYYNITSPQPKVFVLWRMGDDALARPERLTVSYHEGARWMDSDERVDGVPLPPELAPWIAAFVDDHYRPEPRKEKRYASNKDRGRMGRIE
jgi:Protein of unknown function (DUF3305)